MHYAIPAFKAVYHLREVVDGRSGYRISATWVASVRYLDRLEYRRDVAGLAYEFLERFRAKNAERCCFPFVGR